MKKLVFLIIALMMATPVFAANTITWSADKRFVTITTIDTDIYWYDLFPAKRNNGIQIYAIRFNPGAASDRCVINAGSVSGADMFDSSVAADTGDATIQYYPLDINFKMVLDASDGTYNAAAKVTIFFGE